MINQQTSILPFEFTTSADVVGLIISSSDYSIEELNALGSWFMQVGQYITTYAAQMAVIQSRNENKKDGTDPSINH